MAELKTKPTNASVTGFLNKVDNEQRRKDSFTVLKLMEEITGEKPKMWGPSIVGFGLYTYQYASGVSGDWPIVGFSPRKQALTLYIMSGSDKFSELLAKLGKHKTSKACLYVNKLSDIDIKVLEQLIKATVQYMRHKYPKQT